MQSPSIFRRLSNRALADLTLNGEVLDLGGSRKSGYHALIKGDHRFTVVNIDEKYGYDLKFSVEDPFPLADGSYDHVLCLHLLQHVFHYRTVLSESFRVLKRGGTIVHITPFTVGMHGCPYDYFRYTDRALRMIYEEAGFTVDEVRTLGYGPFLVAYQNTSWILHFTLLRAPYRWLCQCIEWLLQRIPRYRTLAENYALGFLVLARKP